MGFDLTNDRGSYVRLSPSGWGFALTLAENYDWHPAGTLPPPDFPDRADYCGLYAVNDGQRVTADDAVSLANALEDAMADADYEEITLNLLNLYNAAVAEQVPDYVPEPAKREDVMEFRNRLEELIAFCREGSFIIE